jgi:P-type conjugative transfer protein TrbJ
MRWLPVAIAVLAVRPAFGQFGGAVYCANCSSELTAAAQYARQLLQLQQEAMMASQEIREAMQLATHPTTNIAADLGMLQSVLMQSTQLAGSMAQMNAAFNRTYAPFNPGAAGSFGTAYSNWAANTLKTLNAAVNAAGYQGQMLQNESAWTAQINALNQTSQGRNQALQLGNAIGTQEVAQLQSLRQLMLTDMSAKAAFMANQVTVQQSSQNAIDNTFGYATPVASGRVW